MRPDDPKSRDLYAEARRYEQLGDQYNAIKLYKLLVRESPAWTAPFQRLGRLYKGRGEWKPAFHYTKKALALDPSLADAWWDLGIAAVAMGKLGLARGIWGKFGQPPEAPQPLSLQLHYDGSFAIVWGETCDPVRARIQSIPAPRSDRRYGDIVLFDRSAVGYQVVDRRRVPVYPELGLFKRSLFHTFSCRLETRDADDIDTLDRLARSAGLGFEVWSNAQRVFTNPRLQPEYHPVRPEAAGRSGGPVEVALAARQEADVLQVLRNWEIICLGRFENLTRHV